MHQYDPRLKMRWSKYHLDLLHKEIGQWLKNEPYVLTTEDDLEAGQHIVKIDIQPTPDRMGLIAGDFFSCLRSSLDHLAVALTLCPNGSPNDSAYFPILGADNSNGRKKFAEALVGVPVDAVTDIKSFQPYHHGKAYEVTELWRLHRLWNIDKHRRIPFHATQVDAIVLSPPDMLPISSGTDSSDILRFPLSAKGDIHLKPPVEIDIQFGDATERIVLSYRDFIHIYNFVADKVMPTFDRFFK